MSIFTNKKQLALDFTSFVRTYEVKKEEKQDFSYYAGDSTILKDSFSLKVALSGRSYILKGKYRIGAIRAFYNTDEIQKAVEFVTIDKILAYKGWLYSIAFVTKTEKLKLTKLATKILSNPNYNPNLGL